MKRFVCLLLALALLLCGCISDPLQEGDKPTTEETTVPSEPVQTTAPAQTTAPTEPAEVLPTEPVAMVETVIFDLCYTDGQEYGTLTAYDEDGSTVWSYTSASYPIGQLDAVSDIGSNRDIYYIVEQGSILAFNLNSGELLWKNEEFLGSPANTNCAVFDEDGTMYICGFFGPDLFAVDASGNTVCHMDYLNYDYYWACGITLTENWLTVYLDGGPEGDMSTPYTAYANVNRLSCNPLSLAEAMELTQDLYNTVMEADGTYVVFEEECYESDGYYTMTVRYQLSDAEADQILANGGIPSANTYVTTVSVDVQTGYIFPETY